MDLLTPMLEPAFRKAGWFPGRKVAVNFAVPDGHPAFPILEAFANLTDGHNEAGEECATSDIAFGTPLYPNEDIREWEAALDTQLVCLGDCSSSHGQIWLDRTGRLFSNSLIHPMTAFVGGSFAEGAINRS